MCHPPPLPRPMPSARHVDDTRSPGWHSYTTLYMHISPGGTRTPRSPPRRRCRPPSTALPASPPPPRCCARSTRTATGAPTSARSRRVLCPPSLALIAATWAPLYGTPSTPLLLPARPRPVHNPRPGAPLLARRGHGVGARWLVDEEDVSRTRPRHVHGMPHRRAGSSTRTTSRASRRRAGTRLRRTSASRWRPSCLGAQRTARCAPLHRRPAAR